MNSAALQNFKNFMRFQFYKRLNQVRRVIQIFTLLLLIAIPLLNRFEINWIIGSLYSVSIGQLNIVDPLMALQTILLSKEIYLPMLIGMTVPVLLALIFGKIFCSWMCPYNTFTEWIDGLEKRFFRKHWARKHSRLITRNPRPAWYWSIFAGLLLLMLVFGVPLMGYLSAPGIISVEIAGLVIGAGVGLQLGFIAIVLALEALFARRFWCKYLCPVGAMLALFRTRKTLRIHYNPAQCDCKSAITPCHYVCPLQLSPKSENVYPYCFNCGLCVRVCEKTGNLSLSLKFDPQQHLPN